MVSVSNVVKNLKEALVKEQMEKLNFHPYAENALTKEIHKRSQASAQKDTGKIGKEVVTEATKRTSARNVVLYHKTPVNSMWIILMEIITTMIPKTYKPCAQIVID